MDLFVVRFALKLCAIVLMFWIRWADYLVGSVGLAAA